MNVYSQAREALLTPDPTLKVERTLQLRSDWEAGRLRLDRCPVEAIAVPGRPDRPELVLPRNLKKRKLSTPEGRAVLIHALAHIEFNAINLALDAVYRFQQMPTDYIADWLRVAAEEARHFSLLRQRLHDHGVDYGDFPAHNGLWSMACKTDHDPLERMALVPRVMEARGLDVTPGMITRLETLGDSETAAVLKIIWTDEVTHVEIGNRWYHHLCQEQSLDPETTFYALVDQHMPGGLRGPFHLEGRRQAGFSETELARLQAQDATPALHSSSGSVA